MVNGFHLSWRNVSLGIDKDENSYEQEGNINRTQSNMNVNVE
jgi:hypothetical protein